MGRDKDLPFAEMATVTRGGLVQSQESGTAPTGYKGAGAHGFGPCAAAFPGALAVLDSKWSSQDRCPYRMLAPQGLPAIDPVSC